MVLLHVDNRSSRNHFVDPPNVVDRLLATLPPNLRTVAATVRARSALITAPYFRGRRRGKRDGGIGGILRRVVSLQTVLLILWGFTLWWGERKVFRDSLRECSWDEWEQWPTDALPHRAVFIADPQLVDAHTYPGRPWPLSALTNFYADLYLYRSHSLLQQNLRPDSTFFLGDLFDGGREWGTETSSSPDKRYKNYKNNIWVKEYHRFVKIFFDTWALGGKSSASSPRGRNIVAGLPGNHDLGFGNGIQKPVVDRFRAYFGEGNRVDILGNHTFVSIDSVSLSAMDQPVSEGASAAQNEEIWKPTEEFLEDIQSLKARAIREELLVLGGKTEGYMFPHTVEDAAGSSSKPEELPAQSSGDFPSIILTHVPFYRLPKTPCGPLREHYPPSSTDPLSDEKNAIKIHKGYQYQNVLTGEISNNIIKKAGPVTQIYSGDDHDYCEIVHTELEAAPREITVKSISLAMGVRRPGFQMASLWNPIDPKTGKSIHHPVDSSDQIQTIQNHLCLLPDQISIFIQYGYVLFLTLVTLFIRAIAVAFRLPQSSAGGSEPLLPLTHHGLVENHHHADYDSSVTSSKSTSTSTSTSSFSGSPHGDRFGSRGSNAGGTAATTTNMTSRTASPSHEGKRAVKQHVQIIGASGASDNNIITGNGSSLRQSRQELYKDKFKDKPGLGRDSGYGDDDAELGISPRRSFRMSIHIFRKEFVSSMKWVGGLSLVWYLWLIWRW